MIKYKLLFHKLKLRRHAHAKQTKNAQTTHEKHPIAAHDRWLVKKKLRNELKNCAKRRQRHQNKTMEPESAKHYFGEATKRGERKSDRASREGTGTNSIETK